jgi:hypothetical protein
LTTCPIEVKELFEVTITRAVGVTALSVAFAAGAVVPAVAASMRGGGASGYALPPHSLAAAATSGTSACAALSAQLVSQITSISADLTAVPPKTADLTGPVGQVVTDVNALQGSGCLPKVPGAPAPSLPAACVPDVAKLLSDAFALVGDLNTLPPNVGDALGSVRGVVADVASLVTAKCLPAVTVTKVPSPPSVTPPKVPGPPSVTLPKVPGPPNSTLPKVPGLPGSPTHSAGLPVPVPNPPLPVPGLPLPAPSLPATPPVVPLPPKLPVPVPTAPIALPTPPKLPVPVPSLPLPLPSVPVLPSLPVNPSLPTLPSAPSLPMLPSAPSAT